MLQNLKKIFQINDIRLTSINTTIVEIVETYDLLDERLHLFIENICQMDDCTCTAYALFLLILCSFYNWNIKDFDYLYSSHIMFLLHGNDKNFDFLKKSKSELKYDALEFYSSSEMMKYIHNFTSCRTRIRPDFSIDTYFFEGESYAKEYYFYSQHPTRNEICTESKLRFEIQENEQYKVHLSLKEKDNTTRNYVGTAMINQKTKLVYIILHEYDENFKETIILSFEGKHYNNDMFYRHAFLLRHSPGTSVPIIEKVCISSYQIDRQIVKGLLNIQDVFYISIHGLNAFLTKYNDSEWMKYFKAETKVKEFLLLSSDEHISNQPLCLSLSKDSIFAIELPYIEDSYKKQLTQLFILYALKSFANYGSGIVTLEEYPKTKHFLEQLDSI